MNSAFEVGSVSLRAQQRALETISNNIANVNTPGFKRTEVAYSQILAQGEAQRPISETEALARPAIGGGVRMGPRETASLQGQLRQTGQSLDIAIDGRGFVELMGPEGETLLWRGGRLTVNRDGYLADSSGIALKASIMIPDDATDIAIGRDGIVTALLAGGTEGGTGGGAPVEIGQIMLVRPESEAGLELQSGGHWVATPDARIVEGVPGEDGQGALLQGMVEESNVDFAASMVEMLTIQRAYAASAQIVQAADQIAGIANNLKR